MKENKYFKEAEFKCKCGKCELPKGMPTDELIDTLVEIRELAYSVYKALPQEHLYLFSGCLRDDFVIN